MDIKTDEYTIKNGKLTFVSKKMFGHFDIPEGVLVIKKTCFYQTQFSSISIPSSVTLIDDEAFFGMDNLKEVTFKENSNCKSIGKKAFFCCRKLRNINLPESLLMIGDECFYETKKLEKIDIPSNILSIPDLCFFRSGIKEINFKEDSKLISVGGCAFYECYDLEKFICPKTVKVLGGQAFYGCSFNEFALSDNLEEIGFCCFIESKIYSLDSFKIPDTVKHIGCYAFSRSFTTDIEYTNDLQVSHLCGFFLENDIYFVYVTKNMKFIEREVFIKDAKHHYFLVDPENRGFTLLNPRKAYPTKKYRTFIFTNEKHLQECVQKEPLLATLNFTTLKDILEGNYKNNEFDNVYKLIERDKPYYLERVNSFLKENNETL